MRLKCAWKLTYFAVSVLLLGACQTAPRPEPLSDGWLNSPVVFEQRTASIQKYSQWKLSAKVGISTQRSRESASLIWEADDDDNLIRIFGPLGVGSVRIGFDRNQAILTDNSGVEHRGRSAEELLTRIVGWQIPMESLENWLFALPDPSKAYQYQMIGESVHVLSQSGWLIEYDSYRSYFDGALFLPKKINASKTLVVDGQQEAVKVRIVVKSWAQQGQLE